MIRVLIFLAFMISSMAISQNAASFSKLVQENIEDKNNLFVYFCPKEYIFTDDGRFAPNLSLLETYVHRADTINGKLLFVVMPKWMVDDLCSENGFVNLLMILSDMPADDVVTYKSVLSKNKNNDLVLRFETLGNTPMYSDNPTRIIYSMGIFNYNVSTNSIKVSALNSIIHYNTDDRFRTKWKHYKDKLF